MDADLFEAGRTAAESVGIQWRPVPADGRWHKVPVEGKGSSNSAGRIKLFPDGEGGHVWNHVSGEQTTFWVRSESRLDQAEQLARRKRLEELRRQAVAERQRMAKEAAEISAKLWERARDVDAKHAYVVAKGIKPSGAKQLRGSLLIPVRNSAGALKGLQFIGPDGAKKFKTGTEIAGNYHGIGKPKDKTVVVCEGWATGCTLHEATGHAVAVAFNAGNLLPVCQALRSKYPAWRLVIVADDDHATPGNPGIAKSTEAARAVGGLLAVPDFSGTERGGKDTDSNDLARLSGMEAVRLCVERAASPISEPPPDQENTTEAKPDSEGDGIERPLLFDESRTPDIPPELLPSWLGEFAGAVARNTQTPPAMAVLLGLAAVATAVAKRFDVAPHDGGYSEPLNLWTATALPPGSRKTAVVSAMTGPLIEWEKEEAERLGPEIRRVAAKRHALEKRKEKLAKDAANAESQERLEEVLQKIERLEGEIPEELRAPRLWTGDTTPERLQSLLVEHGERMAVLTDEGGIFEVMAGLYSGGTANLDIFLQGHAGRAVRVDRQGRAAHLEAPALTFGLAVQPEILAELASGGKRRFRGNGTLARFLFAVPRSNIGSRDVRAVHHISADVVRRYRDGLFDLLEIPPNMSEGREIPRRLTLTPQALDSWHAFAEMIERRQGENGDLEPIQDWSGKLPGAALRIAGGFHLVEHGSKPPAQIEAETVERALDLCALLIEHARAAFGMMESESATADAKAILRWIMEERMCRFRKGLAYRQFKGRFTGKPDRFEKALQELEERAIISAAGKEKTKGRAATVFIVNPALWK
ncbi:MAG: DUF3987 domain-containing protein [Syntrophotaleaceae bacterium]